MAERSGIRTREPPHRRQQLSRLPASASRPSFHAVASLARLERATLCFVGRCSDPTELQRGRLAGEAGIEPAHGLTQNQVPYRLGYSPSVWRKREDSNLCGVVAHPLSRRRRSTGLRHASMALAPRERIELPPRVLETPVLPLHQRGAVPGPWTPDRTEDLAIIDRVLYRLSYPRRSLHQQEAQRHLPCSTI